MTMASPQQPLRAYQPRLQAAFPGATVLGATTAGEFTEQGDTQGAICVWALAGDFVVQAAMAGGLGANLDAVGQCLAELEREHSGYPHATALILLDPLSGNAEEATLYASGLLGEKVRLVGGASADNMEMKKTEVALGERVASDAVVIAMIHSRTRIGIGVCHGHTPLTDPVKVTRSDKNVVYEIDGRPAWEVWTEKTAPRAREIGLDARTLRTSGEIFDYLNLFEAGLSLGDEYKVRVPLSKGDDGSIHFACGMPQNTVLRIMESVDSRQVASAREAVRRSLHNLGSREVAGALVFDCSCRKTILRGEFVKAVEAMRDELGGAPLAGFETYGEIAMEIGEMSGFHNTTTVVVTFEK
jgi:methyl-accepting chemotaxis protein